MDQKQQDKKVSRRGFLKGISIGVAGAFVISALTNKFLPSSPPTPSKPQFPEDSIFAPDKNRYGDTSA